MWTVSPKFFSTSYWIFKYSWLKFHWSNLQIVRGSPLFFFLLKTQRIRWQVKCTQHSKDLEHRRPLQFNGKEPISGGKAMDYRGQARLHINIRIHEEACLSTFVKEGYIESHHYPACLYDAQHPYTTRFYIFAIGCVSTTRPLYYSYVFLRFKILPRSNGTKLHGK